jgi:peroxiredoxin
MATRSCINIPDIFSYICGQYVIKKQRQNITDFVEKAYYAYFGMKLGDKSNHGLHTRSAVFVLKN